MDLRDTPDEAQFRSELDAWLEANVPPELRGHRGGAARYSDDSIRDWSRALYEAGYIGLTWPKEYGGGGKPYSYQAIFLEETARAEAPQHLGVIGLGMAGPTIIALGTEAQKARYLQPLLAADEIWCQGFSEPGAGSDLSAVRTSARLEGSHFVVDGQKVWSSYAHIADWCILVTRSDPASVRHAGLTYLIVDMKAPGVEVRPLRQITGEAEFNEIFFTGVEVPVENVIGEVGGGWQVAMTTLLHERGTLGFALTAALEVMVGKLIELARDRGATPLQRDAIAQEWIELQALRYTAYRSLSALMKTGIPGPEGSILKQQWSEAAQRLTKLALELLGPDAQLLADNAPYGGYWQHVQLRSRGNTIEAGTSEILRNIIAERVLGLPRSPLAHGFRVHARAGGAPRAGARVPRGQPGAVLAGARRARLDRRLGRGGERRRRARLPRGGDPVRGDGTRAHPCAVLVDGRRHAAGAPGRPAGRGRERRGELDARHRPARRRSRHRHPGRLRRRRHDLGARGIRARGAPDERRDAAARRRLGRRGRAASSRAPSCCRRSAPAR